MIDLGTVRPNTKLFIPFNTFSPAGGYSISQPPGNLNESSIQIYKNDSLEQRGFTDGYSVFEDTALFPGISFTGISAIEIDLARNVDLSTFYSVGSSYCVVLTGIAVEERPINFVLATFRIGFADAYFETAVSDLADHDYATDVLLTFPSGSYFGSESLYNNPAGSLVLFTKPGVHDSVGGAAIEERRYFFGTARAESFDYSTNMLRIDRSIFIEPGAGISLFRPTTFSSSSLSGMTKASTWAVDGSLAPIDGKSFVHAVRYICAVLAGQSSGAGSGTETFKGLNGTTNRVRLTVQADGNRTAVTYDP